MAAKAPPAGPPTQREFERLKRVVEELVGRVAENRRDIDMQFQRLAQLQAVIDRIQIGARQARGDLEPND
jgi:hypothetical protein